ncbi:MAG: type IV pilus secretin PilQ [Pyrinomonadaceae bacterium]
MTFLQCLSGFGKKALFALAIISCLALTAFAQKVAPQQEGKHYGDPGFRGEPINLNVVNTDIRDILNYITEQYGVNFVIDKSVSNVPITVNVSDVPWNVALDSILQSQDLGVQTNGSILRIAQRTVLANEATVARQIRDNQLDTSPLYTEFIRLNYARASGSLTSAAGGNAGQFQGGAPSGESAGGGTTSAGGDKGILGIISKRLSRRGSVEVDGRSNTLIVTDVRENIDAVRQLVGLLDQPEPQVEIEARIVIASRNFSRDIGVQLAAVALGRNGQAYSAGNLPGGAPGTNGSANLNPGGIPTGVGVNPINTLASQIPNTVIGLTTGIFGTAQISALITAGEQKGQAKTIATPRITTLNNRSATIESGQQIPIVTTQTGTNGGGVVFTTQYVSVPLRLAVTPQITDANTVVLNVVTENNSVSSTVAAGGTPAINSQRMQTEVMVPDGGTTVVGGALLDVEGDDQFSTPGLSKIPVLKNLFRRKAVSRTSNEILFFITPRIYRPDYQGNPTSSTVSTGTRTTTILQPVPMGNPSSNSAPTPEVVPQSPATSLVPNGQPQQQVTTTTTTPAIPVKP